MAVDAYPTDRERGFRWTTRHALTSRRLQSPQPEPVEPGANRTDESNGAIRDVMACTFGSWWD